MTSRVLLAAWILGAASAHADPVDSGSQEASSGDRPVHYVNLRAGFASISGVDHPTLCMELHSPWAASLESCGTGEGLVRNSGVRDMVHLRMNVPVVSRPVWAGWGAFRAGLGIAKLEAGADHLGFPFGAPDPVTRGSVAGPDAAVSFEWMRPAGRGFEWVATGTAGLGWFAGADRLAVPQDQFQPYVSIEVGAGW